MVSPTKRLRAIKQAYNTNPNAWGGLLNEGALEMLDEAFGVSKIAVNGPTILSVENYIEDQARRMVLWLTGSGGTLEVPDVDKPYLVFNQCSDDVQVFPDGGAGSTVRAGAMAWWFTDGLASFVADPSFGDLAPPTEPVSFNGQRAVQLSNGVGPQDAATKGQVDAIAGSATAAAASAAAAAARLADINDKFRIVTTLPDPATLPEGAVVFLIA